MLTESPQPQSDSSGRVFVSINGENDSLDLFPTEARQSSAPIEPAGPHELFVAEAAPIPPLSSSRPRQAAPRRLLGITEIAVLGIVVAAAIGVGVVLSEPNRGRNDTAVPAPAPASASATMNEKPVTVAHDRASIQPIPATQAPNSAQPAESVSKPERVRDDDSHSRTAAMVSPPKVVASPAAPQPPVETRRVAAPVVSQSVPDVRRQSVAPGPTRQPVTEAPPITETPRVAADVQPVTQPVPVATAGVAPTAPATVTVSSARPVTNAAPATGSAISAAASVPRTDEEAGIRAALGKYRDAYERLDAGAAKRIWSAVDERALSKAFANLESQSLSFDECRTVVGSTSALASCSGSVTYVGRFGSRNSQTQNRQWTFKLNKVGEAWALSNVEVR